MNSTVKTMLQRAPLLLSLLAGVAACDSKTAEAPAEAAGAQPPATPVADKPAAPVPEKADAAAKAEPERTEPSKTAQALATKPLAGPFKTMAAYCKQLETEDWEERCTPKRALEKASDLAAPFERAIVLWSGEQEEGGIPEQQCHLGLETAKGWFVRTWPCSSEERRSKVRSIEGREFLPSAGAEVLVTLENTADDGRNSVDSKSLVVCGVGASGTPSCTDEIVTAMRGKASDEHAEDWSANPFVTGDSIELRAQAGQPPADKQGPFSVTFP